MSEPAKDDTANSYLCTVAGLQSTIGSVNASPDFGDSGDVFDHLHWRPFFHAMSRSAAGRNFINGLGNKLLLRGQSEKRLFKAKAQKITFNMQSVTAAEKATMGKFSSWDSMEFYLNFPTETSRVDAKALTPERLKCMLRIYFVSTMMSMRRLPATSMAIGYGRLVLDFHNIISICGSLKAFSETSEAADPTKAALQVKTIAQLQLSSSEIKEWQNVAKKSLLPKFEGLITLSAAYGGSVSSKEIYDVDEEMIRGVIFWSGLHALMTDISNKNKANHVTADVRERYLSSSFYDDFKRKMTARKLEIANSELLGDFLELLSGLMSIYIFKCTQIKTEKEVAVIDNVMRQIQTYKETSVGLYKEMTLEASGATTHNDGVAFLNSADDALLELLKKKNVPFEEESSSSENV